LPAARSLPVMPSPGGAAARLTALRRTGPGFKFCARSVCTPTRF
jgi:hypothetical protein